MMSTNQVTQLLVLTRLQDNIQIQSLAESLLYKIVFFIIEVTISVPIFTGIETNAKLSGRNEDILKWKPPELNSVDFKLRITKSGGMGMLTKLHAQLFVTGMDKAWSSENS